MGRCRHLAQLAKQLDIRRAVIEIIVADHAAEGFAAELAELLLVDLLEDRALVPGRPLVALQGLAEVELGDVHDTDLQHLVGLGVVDEIVQAAPGTFQLLEVIVMQDRIDLLRQPLVELGDHRLDRHDDVAADQVRLRQRLLRQRQHGLLDGRLGVVGLRLELLVQQGGKFVALELDALQGQRRD